MCMLRATRTHLPLAWEVPVTCRNAEEECVELRELGSFDDGIIRLSRCMHLA